MTPRPGSFAWLMVHDLRLHWRRFGDMVRHLSSPHRVVLVAACALLLHLLALPVARWAGPKLHEDSASSWLLISAVACTFAWMVAQGLFGTARALFQRGDLDLLMSSPLPSAWVFAAKTAAIAASTLGSVALLVVPVANVGILLDGPRWLGVHASLVGGALIATSIGLAVAIATFHLLGPYRARICTQMIGAFIGGAFVLAAQIGAVLPAGVRQTALTWIAGEAQQASQVRQLLMLPMDAVRGDLVAVVSVLVAGVLLFLGATRLLGARFAEASLAAAGAPAGLATGRAVNLRFRLGLGASIRRKEWRLLARDPSMFAQIGLQIVYTVPVAVVLLQSESLPVALAVAPTLVVIASQVAASLAWITVSGEDAPELILAAPVEPGTADRAKLGAVALPVALILAGPIAALALLSTAAALTTAAFASAGAASTALLNLWHPMPGNRRGMLRRHSQSKLIGLIEHVLAILWAVAVVFAFVDPVYAVVPAGLALGGLALVAVRRSRRASRERIVRKSPELPLPQPEPRPESPTSRA